MNMRTTLTLDEDNVAKLRDEMSRTGKSFKEIVNDCLRRGFDAPSEDELTVPFRVVARPMGAKTGFDLDDVSGLLDVLDGPGQR